MFIPVSVMLVGLFCWCYSGYMTNKSWIETCDEESVKKLGDRYYKVTELKKVEKGAKKDLPQGGGVG